MIPVPFARAIAWLRRDRVTDLLAAAEQHEQALRDALQAELATYEGDQPRCPACVVGWDSPGDRSGLITPCSDYPWCSPPRGRHHRAENTVIIDRGRVH